MASGDIASQMRNMVDGVPQGSSISPTLFLIYISDISRTIEKFEGIHIVLYADDLCIWTSKRKKDQLRIALQPCVEAIDDYCRSWCLELNVLKSSYTVFTTAGYRSSYEKQYGIDLFSNKQKIPLDPTPNFLGFIMDPKLSFVSAIDQTIKKPNSRFNIIKILKSKFHRSTINQNFLLRFYKGLARPLFEYIHIPILIASKSAKSKIEVFQNKVIRSCLNCPPQTKTLTLYNLSRIQNLCSRTETSSKNYFKIRLENNDLMWEEIQEYLENQGNKEGFDRRDKKSYETAFCKLLKI